LDLEQASAQIDTLIERRASQREKANSLEAMWAASERKHKAKLREQNRLEWGHFYATLAESLALRAADYHRRARILLEGAE
jgi:multidrug resistance efflux pump